MNIQKSNITKIDYKNDGKDGDVSEESIIDNDDDEMKDDIISEPNQTVYESNILDQNFVWNDTQAQPVLSPTKAADLSKYIKIRE